MTISSSTCDAAGGADPAEVVAAEVDQHDVLGALLRIGQQFLLETQILLGSRPAWPGPGDRAHLDPAPLLAHQHFRGGADHPGVVELQEEHVGRRVDHAQGPVDVEGVDIELPGEALGEHHLDDVAGPHVLLAALHGRLEIGAAEIRPQFVVTTFADNRRPGRALAPQPGHQVVDGRRRHGHRPAPGHRSHRGGRC